MKIGFLFPGQGSQYVGMGKDLYEKYEEVRNIYDRVENLTGVDVKKISFEGPEEELNQTKNTQLCILTMSLAILEILNKNGVKAEISAGLSLGEYSALIYSGILNFEDGVKLVQKRGEYMQNLVPDGEWLMSAILGMGENEVEEVCSKVQNGFAVPVNFNCPGQIVISGDKDGIKEAENIAKQYGARRVIELKTSGPFHTIKLQKASDELRKELDKLQKNLGGIKEMKRLPDAIFVVDPKKEKICIQEAHTLGIPLIGICDTNCDPEELDYVIPGNDDAIRAVKLIVSKMADAVIEAKQGEAEEAAYEEAAETDAE